MAARCNLQDAAALIKRANAQVQDPLAEHLVNEITVLAGDIDHKGTMSVADLESYYAGQILEGIDTEGSGGEN